MLAAMDEDTIADLKQFIAVTVRTAVQDTFEREFEARLEKALAASEARLEAKIDEKGNEILGAIGATLHTHIDYVDGRFDGHERRIHTLEHTFAST